MSNTNAIDKPSEQKLQLIWRQEADLKSLTLLRRTGVSDGRIRRTIGIQEGTQAYKHNHYHDEEFYRENHADGTISNPYGQRMIRVGEDFMVAMLGSLEDEVGNAAAREIMYKCGYQWGIRDMQRFVGRMQAEFEAELDRMRVDFLMESWWWPLTITGWGTWRYDFRQKDKGLLFVELYESAVAKSVGDVGDVLCYFYAGLLASAFSVMVKRPLGSTEIQCYGTGEDFCKFVIADHDRAEAAAFWRSEGASAKDILKKINNM
ncbi:MAG: V4R domain-containing protein [Zavarzinella sp.]